MLETSLAETFVDSQHPWLDFCHFSDAKNSEHLMKALQLSKNSLSQTDWVFDLDSTLFSTGNRSIEIFKSYVEKFSVRDERQLKLLKALEPKHIGYSIRESFERVFRDVLGETSAVELSFLVWADFEAYWMEEFFKGENMLFDQPYRGAADFLNYLFQSGAKICYLTGRAEDLARKGTEESLIKSGFPFTSQQPLYMKPNSSWGDLEYKNHWSDHFKTLKPRKLFFVENEPENIAMFAQNFEQAILIFFHSVMSPRMPSEKFFPYLRKREIFRLKSYS